MTQKELLESVLKELSTIKKGMPNGELKSMVEDMKEMKEDVSELKYMLLNPEDGVVVKTNQNTAFRKKMEMGDKEFQQKLIEIEDFKRWKSGVNKALWIIFSILLALVGKVLLGMAIATNLRKHGMSEH